MQMAHHPVEKFTAWQIFSENTKQEVWQTSTKNVKHAAKQHEDWVASPVF